MLSSKQDMRTVDVMMLFKDWGAEIGVVTPGTPIALSSNHAPGRAHGSSCVEPLQIYPPTYDVVRAREDLTLACSAASLAERQRVATPH
jgi:hypothetical protein